jgi:hypothetical protein
MTVDTSGNQLATNNIDPAACPLCNKNNKCGNIASCESNKGCWCSDPAIQFPDDLLAKIPSEMKNKACICKSCALLYNKCN